MGPGFESQRNHKKGLPPEAFLLLQDRVSLEWFGPIEQVAIRDQNPAAVGSKAFCDRDHLRIEISDPLHLEVFIEFLALDHTRSFHDHEGVDTFTLVFRYDPEYEADEFVRLPALEHPDET